MNVLLINPHTFWISEAGTLKLKYRNFYDNLSIRYLASALENDGHVVDIIDAHFEEISLEQVESTIKKRKKYDIYGISCTQRVLDNAIRVAKYIKKVYNDSLVVVGGYAPTLLGNSILEDNACFDIAMIGEGEESFLELARCRYNVEKWNTIPNIYYREEDCIVRTKAKKPIENLDKLAWPKRAEKYDLGKANILASRGCYGKCRYCSITEFYRVTRTKRFRVRSAIDVVNEMEFLNREKGVYYFDFVDDSFATIGREDKQWIKDFVSELQNRKLNLTWGIQSRAVDVEYELFKELHKVGLRAVSIGIENNVRRIINLFKTGSDFEIHKRAIEILKKLGIDYFIEMIILEPLTTLDEIKENLDFLKEIDYCGSAIQTPITFSPKLELYIGTPVVEDYKGKVNLKYKEYGIDYEFNEQTVQNLRNALLYWQRITGDIAAMHMTYPFYQASKHKKIGLALEAIKLSKQYLQFDLDVYYDLVIYMQQNIDNHLDDAIGFLKKYEKTVSQFRNKYNNVYKGLDG